MTFFDRLSGRWHCQRPVFSVKGVVSLGAYQITPAFCQFRPAFPGRVGAALILKQNRDLVGWIKIEQTTVDYPDVSGARVLSAKNCEETLKKSIP